MSRSIRAILLISLLAVCLIGGMTATQATTAFTVTSTADAVDAMPGDSVCETAIGNGVCTLRAAIQETNALPGLDTILLSAGTYRLTISGRYEDASATGDLDTRDDLNINGAGAGRTIIDANGIDRVFEFYGALNGVPTSVTMTGVQIQGGNPVFYHEEDGGGIANYTSFTLRNSIVTANTADEGAGIYNQVGGNLTIENSTIRNNVGGRGGGVNNRYLATMTIYNSTFQDNSADEGGGVEDDGVMILSNSTVSNNTARNYGGGVTSSGETQIINSTISGNIAPRGGGIFTFGVMRLVNSTISKNTATAIGGGIYNADLGVSSRRVFLRNSIVAGNADANGDAPDCGGLTQTSEQYNLIQDPTGCVLNGDLTGNLLGASARLEPLAANGGPTYTQALLSGSPAIDAGDPAGCTDPTGASLTLDQRGGARAVDGDGDGYTRCDIGAYEFGATVSLPTATFTPSPTRTPKPTHTPTGTPTASNTPTPTDTPMPSAMATNTPTPLSTPTLTASPTATTTPTPMPRDCLAYGVADVGQAASQFFTLDPRTITIRSLGARQEDADIEAVALHPATHELFATTGSDGSQDGYLFHFDPTSDTLTAIGATGFSKVNALAFRPSDGSLWGWVADQGLIQINPATGASRLIHRASGDSSAMAWSADGTQLFVASGTQLWAYNPLSDALTTIGTNVPSTSIILSMRSDGRLLGGVEHDHLLTLFLYDLARRQVVARTTIPVPYDDLEAIAWPGACADALMSDVPVLALSSANRGAPESYFPLHATGFTPRAAVALTINGSRIGTATADAGGELILTLHLNAQAAPGVYAIHAREQPAASSAVGATWGAETQVIVDPAASQLPYNGAALVMDGTLAVYLPLIR